MGSRPEQHAVPCSPDAPEPRLEPGASGALGAFGMLLDALHCGAFLLDRRGSVTHANRRLCEMMGRSPAELVGQSLLDLYPSGAGRVAIDYALNHFDESREQESFLPRRDGTQLPVIVSGRQLCRDGPLGEFRIVTVIDVTPQKRVESELQQRIRDIAGLSDTVLEQALELKHYSERLEQRVHERTIELQRANMESVFMLAVASEAKDLDTGAHVRRIEHYTRLLSRELGIPDKQAQRMGYSAILHDVGKIHVPDDILRKPGALSDEEWAVMRQHTVTGERILSREPFFDVARSIARHHHENWDGSGYPDGLQGTAIPLAARIVHVADVYDALTSVRPYKPAWSPADAADAIAQGQNRSFDPDIVAAFLRLFRTDRLASTGPTTGD